VRLILSIAAVVLAGCADVHDKFAEVPTCKRSAGTDRSIALQVSGPGLRMNGGLVIPGRDLGEAESSTGIGAIRPAAFVKSVMKESRRNSTICTKSAWPCNALFGWAQV